jgi:hypothetical protein
MYTEQHRISNAIEDMVTSACAELFAAYDVPLTAADRDVWAALNEPLLSGVMGFVSPQLRGTCVLACEQGPVSKSCPSGGRPRDWIGELANQLVGRLKTKLLGRDIEIGLSTPVVLQGIRLMPLPRAALEPAVYQSPSGMVLVWVEVEVADGFSLPPARNPNVGETGELMFF